MLEKAGWGTWIRTRTNGVRVRGSTVNLFPMTRARTHTTYGEPSRGAFYESDLLVSRGIHDRSGSDVNGTVRRYNRPAPDGLRGGKMVLDCGQRRMER